jgi:hypothetical protein
VSTWKPTAPPTRCACCRWARMGRRRGWGSCNAGVLRWAPGTPEMSISTTHSAVVPAKVGPPLFVLPTWVVDAVRVVPGIFSALVRGSLSFRKERDDCAACDANGEAGPKGERRRRESRNHSSPIQICRLQHGRDFSTRHPCLVEKRRTSCPPPSGSPIPIWVAGSERALGRSSRSSIAIAALRGWL